MSKVLPILFNTEMVRAILDGRKTVTRRLIKSQHLIGLLPDKCKNGTPEEFLKEKKFMFKPYCDMTDAELIETAYNPPYQPGDILYVRETWKLKELYDGEALIQFRAGGEIGIDYECEGDTYSKLLKYVDNTGWVPSLFMPKEVARIWLKVNDVRVERLQEIMEDTPGPNNQVVREGFNYGCDFIAGWNSTIKKSDLDRYGWDANPYVWAIEFEKCEKPNI